MSTQSEQRDRCARCGLSDETCPHGQAEKIGVVRCDECFHEAPCPPNKPFDPCPNCEPCETCGHKAEGKFRLLFDYPSGKQATWTGAIKERGD